MGRLAGQSSFARDKLIIFRAQKHVVGFLVYVSLEARRVKLIRVLCERICASGGTSMPRFQNDYQGTTTFSIYRFLSQRNQTESNLPRGSVYA